MFADIRKVSDVPAGRNVTTVSDVPAVRDTPDRPFTRPACRAAPLSVVLLIVVAEKNGKAERTARYRPDETPDTWRDSRVHCGEGVIYCRGEPA